MRENFLDLERYELPLPVRAKIKNGKRKFYLIKKSGDGIQLCGIEKPLEQLLQEKFNNK